MCTFMYPNRFCLMRVIHSDLCFQFVIIAMRIIMVFIIIIRITVPGQSFLDIRNRYKVYWICVVNFALLVYTYHK